MKLKLDYLFIKTLYNFYFFLSYMYKLIITRIHYFHTFLLAFINKHATLYFNYKI